MCLCFQRLASAAEKAHVCSDGSPCWITICVQGKHLCTGGAATDIPHGSLKGIWQSWTLCLALECNKGTWQVAESRPSTPNPVSHQDIHVSEEALYEQH